MDPKQFPPLPNIDPVAAATTSASPPSPPPGTASPPPPAAPVNPANPVSSQPPPPAANTQTNYQQPPPPVTAEPEPSLGDRLITLLTRSLDRFEGVNWIAALGALLVAAAAISLLSQQWDAMSNLAQLGAMSAATAIVGGAALGSRRAAPGTSAALVHLTAVLITLVAGATSLTIGGGWPEAAAACGLVGIGVAELMRRTIKSPIHDLLLTLAVCVAAGGLAVVVNIAAAPMVAAAGLALVIATPARRAGEMLAGLAAASPLLVSLNNADFTGDGTLRSMGLLGETLGFAAPIAAAVAAVALGLCFERTRDWRYLVVAGSGVAVAGVASWTVYQPSGAWVALVMAAAFVLVEVAALFASNQPDLEEIAHKIADGTERTLGALTALVVGALAIDAAISGQPDSATVAGAAIAAVAWLIGAYRRASLGSLFMAAAMGCAALIAALVPAWMIGTAVVVLSVGVLTTALRQQDEDFIVTALVALSVGWWIVTVDVAISSFLMWTLPVAFGVALFGEFGRRKQWLFWGSALGATGLAGLLDYAYHTNALPLNAVAACGAAAVVVGAMRRRAVPVLLGSVMTVTAAGYQILDNSIGIEGWGWMALTGAALLTAAAAYEVSGSRFAQNSDLNTGDGAGDTTPGISASDMSESDMAQA